MSCWRWQSSFYLSCTSGEHGRARTRACGTCHSAFVTGQLHFCKYCVSSPIYDHKGAFVLGGCCVFVCGSTSLLFVGAGPDYHHRKRQFGMCLGSVGSGLARCQTRRWPKSHLLWSSLWLSCSGHSQSAPFFTFLLSPLRPSPPPVSDEAISSRKQQMKQWGLKRDSHRRICHSVLCLWNAHGFKIFSWRGVEDSNGMKNIRSFQLFFLMLSLFFHSTLLGSCWYAAYLMVAVNLNVFCMLWFILTTPPLF